WRAALRPSLGLLDRAQRGMGSCGILRRQREHGSHAELCAGQRTHGLRLQALESERVFRSEKCCQSELCLVRRRGRRERALLRAGRRSRVLRRPELEVQMIRLFAAVLVVLVAGASVEAGGLTFGARQDLTVLDKPHEAHVSAPAVALTREGKV